MIRILKKLIPIELKKKYWRYLQKRAKAKKRRISFVGMSPKEIFTFIYNTNHWSGRDSISGGGSDLQHTQIVVQHINQIISDFNIQTILDIPCGDFAWMQYVDLATVNYKGGDIVNNLIQNNNQNFKNRTNVHFEVIDLINDELSRSDILINRDCLVHLSFKDIFTVIENIKNSGCKYLLTTTFPCHKENVDIVTGDWRTLNLEEEPFHFPPPMRLFNEKFRHSDYCDKALGLWEISDLTLHLEYLDNKS